MPDHNTFPALAQRKAEHVPSSQRVVMKQSWKELLFLHWAYDAQGRPGVWFYALDCDQLQP